MRGDMPELFDRFRLAEERARERRRLDRVRTVVGFFVFALGFGLAGFLLYLTIDLVEQRVEQVRDAREEANKTLSRKWYVRRASVTEAPAAEPGRWIGERWVTDEEWRKRHAGKQYEMETSTVVVTRHRSPLRVVALAFEWTDPSPLIRRLSSIMDRLARNPTLRALNAIFAGWESAVAENDHLATKAVQDWVGRAWCLLPHRMCPECGGGGKRVYLVTTYALKKRSKTACSGCGGRLRLHRSAPNRSPTCGHCNRSRDYTVVNKTGRYRDADPDDYLVGNRRLPCKTCGGVGTVPRGDCHAWVDLPEHAELERFREAVDWER